MTWAILHNAVGLNGSPQNSYVEALTNNTKVFGNEAFDRN
jgi:hypothetical protein